MFDRIVYIGDKTVTVKLKDSENLAVNLMNLHLIFEDSDKKVLGEVDDLGGDLVKARLLGEIINGKLIGGVIRKPSLDAKVRVIEQNEIPMIVGSDTDGYMKFGLSPFYNNFPVYLDVNNFFSNHFAIFGNSGSGKSCGISRLFQNMFHDQRLFPYKSNIILFDSSGEYYNAFENLNTINNSYHYRFITTNETDGLGEQLRLPIWLLNANDLTLLLQADKHSQIPIIERMLKLAKIFSEEEVDSEKFKNHLIAKAIMAILYTNETSPNKRNEIFSILESCSTAEFSMESVVQGIGYTRKFRECFLIDSKGQFSESVLLNDYVSSFINEEYDNYEPKGGEYYTLDTLEKALNFTLISEGWLRNENTYGDAVTLRVRLHSLIVGPNAKFFDYPQYISLESYLSSLLLDNGNKYQIININLDDVDDDFAKVITKIYSRLIFNFAKALKQRASIPFHIVVEEAHRYIQNDTDRFLIGYNIFERIAKEGRKYGVILGLISQRPVELSDTVISQCSNFLIFKMNHPTDVDYIRKMVPNISDEIVEKQKTLQSGTCLGFGSSFKIPLIVRLEMPNPAPYSGNANVVAIWNGGNKMPQKNNIQEDDRQHFVAPTFQAVEKEKEVVNTSNVTNGTFVNTVESNGSFVNNIENNGVNNTNVSTSNVDVMSNLNHDLKENFSNNNYETMISNSSDKNISIEPIPSAESNNQILDQLLGSGDQLNSNDNNSNANANNILDSLLSSDGNSNEMLNAYSNTSMLDKNNSNTAMSNDLLNNLMSNNNGSSNMTFEKLDEESSSGIPDSNLLNSISNSEGDGNLQGNNGIPNSSILNNLSNSNDSFISQNMISKNGVASNLDMSDQLNNRELVVPNNSVDIPNEMDYAKDQAALVPTIEDKINAVESGSIRVVPPTENSDMANNTDAAQSIFSTLDSE